MKYKDILGIIISLIGCIIISFVFYRLSITEREPIFIIDPIRTVLIDSNSLPKQRLKVVKIDNTPVRGNITAIRFYFWNNGKEAIRTEHILKPITISLDDDAEILDYKIINSSRSEIINANILRKLDNARKSLYINFRILEKNDGLSGQILYSGNTMTTVSINGVIEGVKDIKTNTSISNFYFYKYWLLNGGIFLLIVGICLISSVYNNCISLFQIAPNKFAKIRIVIMLIGIVLISIGFGTLMMKSRFQTNMKKSILTIVPSQIK